MLVSLRWPAGRGVAADLPVDRLAVKFRMDVGATLLFRLGLLDDQWVCLRVSVLPDGGDLPRHLHTGGVGSDLELAVATSSVIRLALAVTVVS